jgi:hypothetical protein
MTCIRTARFSIRLFRNPACRNNQPDYLKIKTREQELIRKDADLGNI